jgi:hypothetical protein
MHLACFPVFLQVLINQTHYSPADHKSSKPENLPFGQVGVVPQDIPSCNPVLTLGSSFNLFLNHINTISYL